MSARAILFLLLVTTVSACHGSGLNKADDSRDLYAGEIQTASADGYQRVGLRRYLRDIFRDEEQTEPAVGERAQEQARPPVAPGQLVERHLSHGGVQRSYFIYVPDNTAGKPMPVLLAFHGGGGSAQGISTTTRFHEMAASKGFIVVYPEGTGRRAGKLSWNAGGDIQVSYAEREQIDDIGFISRLLDELSSRYPVDQRRVYAAGMSNGGMFAYRLACELSDRIAAVAVVAGTFTDTSCRPRNKVALLHIHGTADENVPLQGGKGEYTSRRASYPPVLRGIDQWATFNGCSHDKTSSRLSNDTTCWSYQGCAKGADTRYCLVEGGGHAWPGAEIKNWQETRNVYVTHSFSASEAVWDFFASHPKQ